MARQTAADTLVLLEERMRRVDYILNGEKEARDSEETRDATRSATARLRALERTLQQLLARSPAAAEVITLQKAHPSLFHSSSTATPALSSAQLSALVLAHSNLYTTLSSQLSQLSDTSIPDPVAAAKLVELHPRIEKARLKQLEQERQMAQLRARSGKAVEKWYEVGVLGMGDCWAGWEERLRGCEIAVRRREAGRRREEGVV